MARRRGGPALSPPYDDGPKNLGEIVRLLAPFDATAMHKHPVSTFVNWADNEGPECARAVEAAQAAQHPPADHPSCQRTQQITGPGET